MLAFILERGKEASTWRGIVAIVTAAGIAIDPAQAEAIVALGLAVIGAIGVFFADKK
jgi:ribosomal protein L12E/L44/L45/RPP1/RPP2